MSDNPFDTRSIANVLYPTPPRSATGGTLGLAQALASHQLGIRGAAVPVQQEVLPWRYVINRFKAFQANLALTDNQRKDGFTKFNGLVSSLNSAYRGHSSGTENAFLIGSWAKDTCIRPPRDVDMYYLLPKEMYYRYELYAPGVNKQSALLQHVKGKLLASYPRSVIRGDGPIVLADFHGSTVEIAPAFLLNATERSYYVCDTKNGGRYLTTKPFHEIDEINYADNRTNKNVRPLIRMLKCWQAYCSVPIKSFYLELLAIEFLDIWGHNEGGTFYYDWMCRDFFQWMISRANRFVVAPGTYEVMDLGCAWKSRAETAYGRAEKACDFEQGNHMIHAGDEWQKIFGTDIPRNA